MPESRNGEGKEPDVDLVSIAQEAGEKWLSALQEVRVDRLARFLHANYGPDRVAEYDDLDPVVQRLWNLEALKAYVAMGADRSDDLETAGLNHPGRPAGVFVASSAGPSQAPSAGRVTEPSVERVVEAMRPMWHTLAMEMHYGELDLKDLARAALTALTHKGEPRACTGCANGCAGCKGKGKPYGEELMRQLRQGQKGDNE